MASLRRDGLLRSVSYLLPVAYVAGAIFVTVHVMGARGQGWADEPLNMLLFRNMLAGPKVLPLAVALIVSARWEPLVMWMTGPIFFTLWAVVLGRGVTGWYAVIPAPIASAALAVGIAAVVASKSWSVMMNWTRSHKRWSAPLGIVIGCFVARSLWREASAQYQRLDGSRRPTFMQHVAEIIDEAQPRTINVINCNFALAYEPLRTPTAHVSLIYVLDVPEDPSDGDLTVWCQVSRRPGPPEEFGGCTLAYSPELAIYSRAACARVEEG
jgi:hypothetical protein